MIAVARRLAAGAVLAGAAIGLAGPASAQLTEGSYTWTVTGGGPEGSRSEWTLTMCGQDCMTVHFPNETTLELHLRGNTWTGTDSGRGCTYTVDNNSLAGQQTCPDGASHDWRLTKNG